MGTRCSTFSEQTLTEQLNTSMKLIILISLVACGYAAKLDRTYLPPASAASAGGSPGSLLAPGFGQAPLDSSNAFGRQPSGSSGPSGFGATSFGQGSIKPGLGQPGQNGFQPGGQPSAGFNQPSGSSGFGQPSGSAGYGSGGFNQPGSGAGFSQPTGPEFGPSSVGQSNFPGSSQSGFSQGSPSAQKGSYNIQAYSQPQRAQAAAEQGAQILRYENQNDGDTFSYSFETSNGIRAEESGTATNGVRAQGGFSYIGDDGQDYSITYTADENGYQPQGQHLPTPHPIPAEILKSIEENARAAAAGTQEGAYRPEEYENEGNPQTYNNAGSSFNRPGQGPSELYGPSKSGSGSNQGAQGYSQQGSQSGNGFGQYQNRGFGQGNQQSISAPGNQFNQQAQFGPSGTAQGYVSSGDRKPQGQFPLGQGSGANQGYGQSSFGQTGPKQGSQGFGGPESQGQFTFGQGGFGGQGGAGQSGYEYNRPQGSGQFGSQSPGQSGSTASRPGTGSNQGSFGFSDQGPKPSYGTTNQPGQGSQYRPGQSTFGSGPSASSSTGQAPTGSQGQFGPGSGQSGFGANQGRPNTFGSPRQPPSFNAQEGYKY